VIADMQLEWAKREPATEGPVETFSGPAAIVICTQRAAAFAMKQDATTGSIEVGKRADLVVLDRDIFSVDPYTIGDTKVVATYLDGLWAPASKFAEAPVNPVVD
jgi:predicted amidohydrolase YtcJ